MNEVYVRRMPPGATVRRRYRGKVKARFDDSLMRVSLWPKNGDGIIGYIETKLLIRQGVRGKVDIFDYLVVSRKGSPQKILIRPVKPGKLTKKQIERIKREVERLLPPPDEY